MFWWFTKKHRKNNYERLEHETKQSFLAVKKDIHNLAKWIKHLDEQDKHLFKMITEIKDDISSLKDEVYGIQKELENFSEGVQEQQLFKKTPVVDKQTADLDVQNLVQTDVQTDNIYNILKRLSSNEKLIVYTILNSEMKLSYEDLALLLGKEKATIRGQVNSIKQKCYGLIEEVVEKNGKKRVYIPEEIREKLHKYSKTRLGKKR